MKERIVCSTRENDVNRITATTVTRSTIRESETGLRVVEITPEI
jgi:hypothetical protein